jgi:hypothetical protein
LSRTNARDMVQTIENTFELIGIVVSLAFAYLLVFGGRIAWFVRYGQRAHVLLRFNSASTELKRIYRVLTSREA